MNKNYTSLSVEDLAQDDLFRRWVLQVDQDNTWDTWIAEQSEDRKQEIKEASRLVKLLSHDHQSTDMDFIIKDRLWKRISTTIESQGKRPKTTIKWLYPTIAAIAASLVLFVFVRPILSPGHTEIYAQSVTDILLPTDSKVKLYDNTKLTYENKDWDKKRTLTLEGKAFFDVTKGKPFVISTASGTVSVLGTSFEVDADEDKLIVEVSTGRVEVATSMNTEVLVAHDSYYYNPSVDDLDDTSGDTGRVYYRFNMKDLSDVLVVLAEAYDVEVDMGEVEESGKVTCFFDSQDSLSTALQKVLWPLNLKYDINNKRVTVR